MVLKHSSTGKELIYQQHTKSKYLKLDSNPNILHKLEQEDLKGRNLFMNNILFSLQDKQFMPFVSFY
jgi:hypothetical protein